MVKEKKDSIVVSCPTELGSNYGNQLPIGARIDSVRYKEWGREEEEKEWLSFGEVVGSFWRNPRRKPLFKAEVTVWVRPGSTTIQAVKVQNLRGRKYKLTSIEKKFIVFLLVAYLQGKHIRILIPTLTT